MQSELDGLPLNGAAFGLQLYLARDDDARSRLAALPPRAVLFNFLGTQDLSISPGNGLRVLDEPIGRTRDPHASRAYELELNCYVSNDALTVSLEFSRALHDSTAIRAFGTQLLGAFETIIASLVPRANVGGFDAATLAAVAASLNRAKSS